MNAYVGNLRNVSHCIDGDLLRIDVICGTVPNVFELSDFIKRFDQRSALLITADEQSNVRIRAIFADLSIDPEMFELLLSDKDCARTYFSIPCLAVS